ncbi:MAG: DUF167 domain-containing protein [Acidimicrobiia bacterium]
MTSEDLFVADGTDAVLLSVHAQPGAGRSGIVGRHGTALKVKVAAPPADGRANDAIARLLADEVGLPARAVTLVTGASSRSKRFRLEGVEPAAFKAQIDRLLAASPSRPAR